MAETPGTKTSVAEEAYSGNANILVVSVGGCGANIAEYVCKRIAQIDGMNGATAAEPTTAAGSTAGDNTQVERGFKLSDHVKFAAINTDGQAIQYLKQNLRQYTGLIDEQYLIEVGKEKTAVEESTVEDVANSTNAPKDAPKKGAASRGRGAGAKPNVGAKAIKESLETGCLDALLTDDLDMVVVVGGMGGGTGTYGVSEVLDYIMKHPNYVERTAAGDSIMPLAFITMPDNEGKARKESAILGYKKLKELNAKIITLYNQDLEAAEDALAARENNRPPNYSDDHIYGIGNDKLSDGIISILELVVTPGIINLDFADLRTLFDLGNTARISIAKAKMPTEDEIKKASADPADPNAAVDPNVKPVKDYELRARTLVEQISGDKLSPGIQNAQGLMVLHSTNNREDFNTKERNAIHAGLVKLVSGSNETNADIIDNMIIGKSVKPWLEEGEYQITVIATGFDDNLKPPFDQPVTSADSNAATKASAAVASGPDGNGGKLKDEPIDIERLRGRYEIKIPRDAADKTTS